MGFHWMAFGVEARDLGAKATRPTACRQTSKIQESLRSNFTYLRAKSASGAWRNEPKPPYPVGEPGQGDAVHRKVLQ